MTPSRAAPHPATADSAAEAGAPVALALPAGPAALLPQRALFLPQERALVIADAHWGKSETLRSAGIPMPAGVLDEQLARLDAALDAARPETLIVLGDLFHAPAGVTESLRRRVMDWLAARRRRAPLRVRLIEGNHDLKLGRSGLDAFAADAQIELDAEGARLGAWSLYHDPGRIEPREGYSLSGHIHPAVTLRGGGDCLKLPCFVVGPDRMILPAFSCFAAGVSVRPTGPDRLYACSGARVIAI